MASEFLDQGLLKMTLLEHLAELRRRLGKVALAILVLGGVSLAFSKVLFGVLMRPVLQALPKDMSSLVYTSAIEEFNVLMKVGLYAGVFFATPVVLWQVWGFVSPGLYSKEKRWAGPFVALGSIAFLAGALFCYGVVLPTMFEFLLNDPSVAALSRRLEVGRTQAEEAVRYLRFGNIKEAGGQAQAAWQALGRPGDGKIEEKLSLLEGAMPTNRSVVFQSRLEGLGRLLDAAGVGFGSSSRPVLMQVMAKRRASLAHSQEQRWDEALASLDEAASLLAGVSASDAEEFAQLWRLERMLSLGQAQFVSQHWTRPMLSMNEQLTLVLVLMLAFGVIFELPLVMWVLGLAGFLTSKFLFKYQRHAFVFCLILAAVITPTGDAVNLSLMAGPMFFCYELGVLAVWLQEKRSTRSQPDASPLA